MSTENEGQLIDWHTACVLYKAGVNTEYKGSRGWRHSLPNSSCVDDGFSRRVSPDQPLTFKQACLMRGFGLVVEVTGLSSIEDRICQGDVWDELEMTKYVTSGFNYSTPPLPATKWIPHTVESAPAALHVNHSALGHCEAHVRTDGAVILSRHDSPHVMLPFADARDVLTDYKTGKPYGQEVTA
jgi:hypothetical protein